MIAGDLVTYQGGRWFVVRVDDNFRTALLVNQAGQRTEVPDSIDKDEPETLQVMANPPTEWPFVALPTKRLTGPVITIMIPNPRARDRVLETWADWVPADPVREGGVLYFNPALGLRHGAVLVATFRNGTKGRITIPRNFGTAAQRTAVATAAAQYVPPEEKTRFNRDRDVLGEDD